MLTVFLNLAMFSCTPQSNNEDSTVQKAEYKNRLPFWNEVTQTLETQNSLKINSLLAQIQKKVVSEYFLKNAPSEALQELKMMQRHNPIGLSLATQAAVLNRTDVSNEKK